MVSRPTGLVTTGTSHALALFALAKTKEEVPALSPASPSLLSPMAYIDAMASEQPATTGVPSARPVCLAASFVTVPIISVHLATRGISLFKSTPMAAPISSAHFSVDRFISWVREAVSTSIVSSPVRR